MLGSLAFSLYNYFACRPLVGRSVLRSLFSVLQGAKAPFPCRGVGQRPTALQSTNLQISQLPFVSFVSFVIAAQREACPNFQTSKLLSFQSRVLRAVARP